MASKLLTDNDHCQRSSPPLSDADRIRKITSPEFGMNVSPYCCITHGISPVDDLFLHLLVYAFEASP
jgi:hypothetical protein